MSYLHSGDRLRGLLAGRADGEHIDAAVADLREVLATQTSGDVAALIAEPVQGVGGFVASPDGTFAAYRKVLDETGILYISDEVQTGWGRTGEHFWGYQAHGVVPDLLTFAKGIGNGLALAGVVGRADVMNAVPASRSRRSAAIHCPPPVPMRSSTICSTTTCRPMPPRTGAILHDGLRDAPDRFPIVADVRGKGLMLAIEFVEPGTLNPNAYATTRVFEECKRRGLLVGKGGLYGNTVRMGPPMTLTEDEAREGLAILLDAIERGGECGVMYITHFIGGKSWDGDRRSGAATSSIRPPARSRTASTFASIEDVDAAVASAVHGAAVWRETSLAKRQSVMFAFREIVHARRDELAALVTAEHGKVLTDAAGEVQRGLEVIEYACGIGTLLRGRFQRERLDRRRLLRDPPATRRRRGHLAVQLPGDGAAVVRADRDRRRQRGRAEAVRERSERTD